MNSIWPLAIITFKEGVRTRSLYGISILALIFLAANFLLSGLIMQDVGKVSVDMALSTVAFSGLLVVLFVGINLLGKDLDRKTIYIVLSRPISRGEYIWGKFLGIALLITVIMSVLGLFAVTSIYFVKITYPLYFPRFAWAPIGLAVCLSTLGLILLSALSVLFSSFCSSSFVVLILTTISYLIGQSLGDIKALVESPQSVGIEVTPLTLRIIGVAYYIFPNLSLFDLKTQAAHNLSVSWVHISWVLAYGIVYASLVILFATLIFGRREFP